MTLIELIHSEIGKIPEDRLGELYGMIRDFAATQTQRGIMAKLQEIQIDAPADFASSLDLYTSGEKSVGDDIH